MNDFIDQLPVLLAAAAAVLGGLYLAAKPIIALTKTKKDDEWLENAGKVLDELDVIDADGDGK